MRGKDSQVESTASTPRAEPASRKAFASNRGRATLIAAGAALLFLAWQLLRPAAVDPELQGTWELDFSEGGVSSTLVWEIGNGRYGLTIRTEETGRLTASDGVWTLTSTGGRTLSGTYEASGPDTLVTAGEPLGTMEWMRRTSRGAPGGPGRLDPRWVGSWSAAAPPGAAAISLSLSVRADGTCRLSRRTHESGRIRAEAGLYEITAARGVRRAGSYYFHGEDAVAISGPPGAGLWSKQR
jgi:hypothetical protein